MERVGGLLAAVPVGGDAEVQGDEGGCEPDRDQQASETDPGASTASQAITRPPTNATPRPISVIRRVAA